MAITSLHLSRAGESAVRSMMTETAEGVSERVRHLAQSEFELTRMEEERNHRRQLLLNAQETTPGTDTRSHMDLRARAHRDWLFMRNRAAEHANYCERKREDLRIATRHAARMVESSRYLANVPGIADGLDDVLNAAPSNRSTTRAPLAYPVLSTRDYHDEIRRLNIHHFYIRRFNIRRGAVDPDNRPFDVDTDDEADAAIRQEQQEQTPGARNAEDEAVEVMAAAATLAKLIAEKVPLVRTRLAQQGVTAVDETIAEELQAQGGDVDCAVELLAFLARAGGPEYVSPDYGPIAGWVDSAERAEESEEEEDSAEESEHLRPYQTERVLALPSPTTKENLRTLMALVDVAGDGMKKGEVLSEGTWLEMCNTLKEIYAQVDIARV